MTLVVSFREAAADSDWTDEDEKKHPRAQDGRFRTKDAADFPSNAKWLTSLPVLDPDGDPRQELDLLRKDQTARKDAKANMTEWVKGLAGSQRIPGRFVFQGAPEILRPVLHLAAKVWFALDHLLEIPKKFFQRWATQVAKELGHGDKYAERVAKGSALIDALMAWTVNIPLAHGAMESLFHLHGWAAFAAAKIGFCFPTASLMYVATSLLDPRSTWKTMTAAWKVLRGKDLHAKKVHESHSEDRPAPLRGKALVVALSKGLAAVKNDNWWFALFSAAFDATHDPARSIDIANELADSTPPTEGLSPEEHVDWFENYVPPSAPAYDARRGEGAGHSEIVKEMDLIDDSKVAYKGPRGGEGHQDTRTGKVTYEAVEEEEEKPPTTGVDSPFATMHPEVAAVNSSPAVPEARKLPDQSKLAPVSQHMPRPAGTVHDLISQGRHRSAWESLKTPVVYGKHPVTGQKVAVRFDPASKHYLVTDGKRILFTAPQDSEFAKRFGASSPAPSPPADSDPEQQERAAHNAEAEKRWQALGEEGQRQGSKELADYTNWKMGEEQRLNKKYATPEKPAPDVGATPQRSKIQQDAGWDKKTLPIGSAKDPTKLSFKDKSGRTLNGDHPEFKAHLFETAPAGARKILTIRHKGSGQARQLRVVQIGNHLLLEDRQGQHHWTTMEDLKKKFGPRTAEATESEFDSEKHPRSEDGRFTEKFGERRAGESDADYLARHLKASSNDHKITDQQADAVVASLNHLSQDDLLKLAKEAGIQFFSKPKNKKEILKKIHAKMTEYRRAYESILV